MNVFVKLNNVNVEEARQMIYQGVYYEPEYSMQIEQY